MLYVQGNAASQPMEGGCYTTSSQGLFLDRGLGHRLLKFTALDLGADVLSTHHRRTAVQFKELVGVKLGALEHLCLLYTSDAADE